MNYKIDSGKSTNSIKNYSINKTSNKKIFNNIDMYWLNIILAFILSALFVEYMRIPNLPMVWIGMSILLYILMTKCKKLPKSPLKEKICNCIFSGMFSFILVLGNHIQIRLKDGEYKTLILTMYKGRKDYAYITEYSILDVFGFFALFFISLMLFRVISYSINSKTVVKYVDKYTCKTGIWQKRKLVLIAVVLFIMWLPYLIFNYPGFIFGDSIWSINQAMGIDPYTNHHPLVYTLFIKLCLVIGIKIKNITFGCCIYSIIQMIVLAFGISYLTLWIRKKGTPKFLCIVVIAYFGLTPYYAQNSIAMWKDPIFSIALMMLSTLLFDLILTKGKLAKEASFWSRYMIYVFIICFFRNNGLYIMLLCEVLYIIYAIIRKNKYLKRLAIVNGVFIVVVWIVTNPVYKHFNLKQQEVESVGVFLNQMARVVAYDGKMSKSDKKFMDRIYPLEDYEDTYRPGCIDMLKWNGNFDNDYLDDNMDKFWKTYLSMFVKNPKIYFEAWQLSTFGYWSFNYWELNNVDESVEFGNPFDVTLTDLNIETKWMNDNIGVPGDAIFSYKGKNISLSILTWIVIFIAMVMLIKKWDFIVALAPIIGLIITLVIAAPLSYWPRYGLAQCYMIPLYFIAFIYTIREVDSDKRLESKNE